ncbi:uncharacterized protein AMSG_03972 [Thecamonas trahens ATCC 50062]|uniref:FAD-binding FR-type domain-containing protein n=1 Tax=Thecamonas trahens ATCC 50062 TaxID=461836 RepID=A0A0L0D6B9_THETB|nr:hypothetical protein AMSG_03972 [Thecamonas trahens ATCC 50062]KNC47745.1 hypothetical protein AMSG_03972 [Thecamonas trahens ATCC 50062]|eukprot:XP_013759223.1 hypothetical protein AMSG_03972 [Thecamonas trahens ATCC 50062]
MAAGVKADVVVAGLGVVLIWSALALAALTSAVLGIGNDHKVVSSDKSGYVAPFVLGKLSKFCLSLLYLPVIRYPGLDLWVAGGIMPFERRLKFHRGMAAVFLAVASLHGVWMALKSKFSHFGLGGVSLSGTVALVLFLAVGLGSLPWIRRHHFNSFYALHMLQFPAVIAALVHVPGIVIYLAVSGGVWLALAFARMVRAWRRRRRATLVPLPGEATELSLVWPRQWPPPHPGSYAFLRIGAIASTEWHPFSVADYDRHCGHTRFIVKAVHHHHHRSLSAGSARLSWTARLREMAEAQSRPTVWIDGAYGALTVPANAVAKAGHIVLVSGGVGVTPMANLLQHVADGEFPNLRSVLFVWTSRLMADVCTPWLGNVLAHATSQLGERLCISLYQTSGKKELPSSSPPSSNSSSSSSSSSSAAIASYEWSLGRPDLDAMLANVHTANDADHSPLSVFVAVCGPPSLCNVVASAATRRGFAVHVETFVF